VLVDRIIYAQGHSFYVVHRPGGRRSIWFVHGLGCWSASWIRALDHPALGDWGLYVPDLPGFGRTPPLDDPNIGRLAAALNALIAQVEGEDGAVAVVAHSLGGEVTTHIAQREPGWLKAFVNVEGNLDTSNTTVGRAVAEADDFNRWFDAFADELYRHGADGYVPLRHVHAGLLMCDRPTFRRVALDAYRLAREDPPGQRYAALTVPRIYFRGTDFPDEAAQFLLDRGLAVEVFEGSGHFPMLDAADDFFPRLSGWLSSTWRPPDYRSRAV
jgi:pimeloyl-ACP methyl ester carboxylesterase